MIDVKSSSDKFSYFLAQTFCEAGWARATRPPFLVLFEVLVHLEDQNFGVRGSVLRHRHEIAV
jgi:hypothetical protein